MDYYRYVLMTVFVCRKAEQKHTVVGRQNMAIVTDEQY